MTNLRDPFDKTFDKGGFTYVQWSQVADRLDEVTEGGWSFSILQLGPDWAHGRLTIGDRHFENVGYAENAEADWKKEPYKDAVSDAFKRCAALAGVARYLYDKGDAQHSTKGAGRVTPPPARPAARTSTDVPEFAPDGLSDGPRTAQDARGGSGWTFGQLAKAAEDAGIAKVDIYRTADKLFGPKTKVTDLEPGQREQIAFEMGLLG